MSIQVPELIMQMISRLNDSSENKFVKDNTARSLEAIRDKIDVALKRYYK